MPISKIDYYPLTEVCSEITEARPRCKGGGMKKIFFLLFLASIALFASGVQAQLQTIEVSGQVLDETNGSFLENVWVGCSFYDYELMRPVAIPKVTTGGTGYFTLIFEAKHQDRPIEYTLYKKDYVPRAGQFTLRPGVPLKFTMRPLKAEKKPVVVQQEQLKTGLSKWDRIFASAFAVGTFFVFLNQTK